MPRRIGGTGFHVDDTASRRPPTETDITSDTYTLSPTDGIESTLHIDLGTGGEIVTPGRETSAWLHICGRSGFRFDCTRR
ncbi:MAG: hypothetical protein GX911_05660 [Spirochaetales bacterium]|nr:hypothetical protein [Spirochaetales bacterium]